MVCLGGAWASQPVCACVRKQARVAHLFACFCLFSAGVALTAFAIVAFLVPSGAIPSFETVTISGYLVFLGLIMCTLELNFSLLQKKLRRYFGFLFSFLGRSVFIMFAGSMALALALVSDGGSGNGGSGLKFFTILGGVTILNGLFNCVVLLCHPSFTKERGIEADILMKDPYASNGSGSKDGSFDPATASGETVLVAMLKSNPRLLEMAVEAATAGPGASKGARSRASTANSNDGGRSNRSRSFVAVINPFRGKTPRPSATTAAGHGPAAPASDALDDDHDEEMSAAFEGEATVASVNARANRVSRAGSGANSGKGGDVRSSINPFNNAVSAAAAIAGSNRASTTPTPAPVAARRTALVHQESSLPNVFAMEGSFDARSYGDQRDSPAHGSGDSAASNTAAAAATTSTASPSSPANFANPFR
jgi:COPI associated protein